VIAKAIVSTDRSPRRQECSDKKSYPTYGAAVRAMKWTLRERGNEGWPMKPYRCRFCSGFHFGHMPLSDIRGRKVA